MEHELNHELSRKKGIALIFALILLGIFVILIGGLLTFLEREYFSTTRYYNLQKSLGLAEAGIDKAMRSLNADPNYTGETNTSLGEGTFSVSLSGLGDSRIIESKGKVGNIEKIIRVQTTVTTDQVGFHYGAQVGSLGLIMSNQSKISGTGGTAGNVYSNGSITPYSPGHRGEITGDVYVAKNGNRIENIDIGHDAHAHTLKNCTAVNDIYYVSGGSVVNCTYGGALKIEPGEIPEKPLPIAPETISKWKTEATAGGERGAYSLSGNGVSDSLGPIKINGDMLIDNNAILTVTGTIWVTGNITIRNGATVKLSSGYGLRSGVIIADSPDSPATLGTIWVGNNVTVTGSGASGSYIMLLSTNTKSSPDDPAIDAGNNSASVIFYASAGMLTIENNASLKEVTGYGLYLKNGAQITYESGLASANFASGPGGGWKIKKGTWVEVK